MLNTTAGEFEATHRRREGTNVSDSPRTLKIVGDVILLAKDFRTLDFRFPHPGFKICAPGQGA